MDESFVSHLKPTTIHAYQSLARQHGRSLEAELRAAIEGALSKPVKDCEALLRLSDQALAMTPPDGPPVGSDSTLLIRWDRDTNQGDWVDDGWDDRSGWHDEAGR